MGNGIDISVFGDKELDWKFAQLGYAVQKKLVKSSLMFGAEIVKSRADELAPKDSGRLSSTLNIVPIKTSKKNGIGFKVETGTRTDLEIPADATGYYPITQEFGSSKTPAKPYIRPATEQSRSEVLSLMEDDIRSAVE